MMKAHLNKTSWLLFFLMSISLSLWLLYSTHNPNQGKVIYDGDAEQDNNDSLTSTLGPLTPPNILQLIEEVNRRQVVINQDRFGPLSDESVVIVIQVHTRARELGHLIGSLSRAKGIEQALVIFSHDYYDLEINRVIRSIRFCKVMQIFYPYSLQTHPNQFPGQGLDDCPSHISKSDAVRIKCANADSPDLNGIYRNANYTQLKHHWWWKANRVFNQLRVTQNYNGLVLFLEEDLYVTEDFLHVLKLMDSVRSSNPDYKCDMLLLGTDKYDPSKYSTDCDRGELRHWITTMGLSFDRFTWMEIKGCAEVFCTYDDYNWDWSLQYTFQHCLQDRFHMFMKATRVFHIGRCGFHAHNQNCDPALEVSKIQSLLKGAERHMFPSNLTLTRVTTIQRVTKGNGGWADKRDHKLCLSMATS